VYAKLNNLHQDIQSLLNSVKLVELVPILLFRTVIVLSVNPVLFWLGLLFQRLI